MSWPQHSFISLWKLEANESKERGQETLKDYFEQVDSFVHLGTILTKDNNKLDFV